MTKQKFMLYVSASTRDWDLGKVYVTDYDPTPNPTFQMVLICKHEIGLDVPEFDIRDKAVVALEAEIQKERADSQVRVNMLLERISKLQAIGHE